MKASKSLPSSIIRRWVRLQDRVTACEHSLGPNGRMTEQAVRDLIDFEVDVGPGLQLALQACPVGSVRTRVREEDFQDAA